jgi:hypothetical protein
VNKKDVAPVDVRIRHMKMEGVEIVARIDGLCRGALQPGYLFEKHESAPRGAGITTFLGTETRTSTLQDHCKR